MNERISSVEASDYLLILAFFGFPHLDNIKYQLNCKCAINEVKCKIGPNFV